MHTNQFEGFNNNLRIGLLIKYVHNTCISIIVLLVFFLVFFLFVCFFLFLNVNNFNIHNAFPACTKLSKIPHGISGSLLLVEYYTMNIYYNTNALYDSLILSIISSFIGGNRKIQPCQINTSF